MMLIYIVLFLICFYIGSKISNMATNSIVYCKQHKWIYRLQDGHEYMVCEKCGKIPGEDYGSQV